MVEVGRHWATPTTPETSAGRRRSMVAVYMAFVQCSPMGGQTLTGGERLRDGAQLVSRCRRDIARARQELRINPIHHRNPPSAIADAPPKIPYIWRSMLQRGLVGRLLWIMLLRGRHRPIRRSVAAWLRLPLPGCLLGTPRAAQKVCRRP